MTRSSSSPLVALIRYYERLQADANQPVAEFGFAPQGVSYCLVLERDGTLTSVDDLRDEAKVGKSGKSKRIPRTIVVPFRGNRSGQKPLPNFLCDNSGYVLGRDASTKPDLLEWKREQFRLLHERFRDAVADPGLEAICLFLATWNPDLAPSLPNWVDLCGSNLVFKLRGELSYVHDAPSIQSAWIQSLSGHQETYVAPSLVTGHSERVARLHEPAIKHVYDPGGQAEKRLVCFNENAFESYGKSQSFNAPVGIHDAFRYSTSLNRLLSDDGRRVRIGDATVVFWSDRSEGSDAEETFRQFFGEAAPKDDAAEHRKTVDRLREFLTAARQGRLADWISDPEAPFYVLGLSPNASRLNVRYWLVGTVRQFAERLARHAADLEIVGKPKDEPWLSIQSMLAETSRGKDGVPPQLAAGVSRAILAGLPTYPDAFLGAIVHRARADGEVSWRRAAILKAFLKREGRFDVDVYLNKEHPEKAYHCGRLLAVLAFAQEQALGAVNTGVIRRNLGSVMAMPGLMLGRLQRAAEVGHIPKLERDLPVFVQDELKAINVRLKDDVPVHLSLREQSLFALGFYQQLQYLAFIGQQVKASKRVRTSQGEWVRSKLEARVADALTKFKFAYIYEPSAMLAEGSERWPDFVIRRGQSDDLYIEVLGMNTPDYNLAWERKRRAYHEVGITEDGGPKGRLIVLDFRDQRYDDTKVLDSLRPYFNDVNESSTTDNRETGDE
jgi:CRISPR-associated protein Csd1